VRQREQELRPRRVTERRPLGAEILGLEAGRVHDGLALVRIQRADRVDDRAPRLHPLGRRAQQGELQVWERLRAPAEIRAPVEDAEAGAGRVHERTVETLKSVGQLERVRVHDTDVCSTEPLDVAGKLARASLVLLDGHDLALELRRLASGGGAEIERPFTGAGTHGEPGELRAAALRPDPPLAQRALVDTLDAVSAGYVGRLARRITVDKPDSRLRRLVLGAHERDGGLAAEVPLPDLGDPVRVRELERPVRQRGEQIAQADREPTHDRVRERYGTFQTGAADELDRLVHRRVPRDAAQVGDLVRADAQRGTDRWVELRDRSPRERFDAVVERADTLHGPVGDLRRQGAVARVEALRCGSEGTVGVRVVLEDAPHDLVRGTACGRDGHRYGCAGMDTWEPYARAPQSTVVGELVVHRGLGRELLALLPASYGGGGSYPVLYAQDGQNLFDEATAHSGEWRVDETMAELAGEGVEAIVVGIANRSDARASEYSPWPQAPHVEHGRAVEYLDFVLGSVKPLVDRSFRTEPGPDATGMLGSSLGALVSLYAFFSWQGTLGFAGAMSTAFFGGDEAFAFFEQAPFVDGRIWLDTGDLEAPTDPDANGWYVEGFERMATLLERKGYGPDRLHAAVVPGGVHIESAWAARFPDAMRFWLGR